MWVVEPPATGQVHISVGVGEGVQMTPEVRATIERFLDSLMAGEDIAALADPFMCGGAYNRCGTFTCQLDNCKPLKSVPCFQLVSCRVDL